MEILKQNLSFRQPKHLYFKTDDKANELCDQVNFAL